jgi:four helix bundle protein
MAFRFEDLKVWHKTAELSNEIDLLARQFSVEERFNLASQIKRAADSVVLNIAEGSTGNPCQSLRGF